MPGNFIDTNVILYAVSQDRAKADRAEEIIRKGGIISVQVLNEMANVSLRKMRMSWPDTEELLSTVRGLLSVVPITVEVHTTGITIAKRYNLSIYDSMVISSALHNDCDTLWSEDMQHGMMIDKQLRIWNPFTERV